METYIFKVEPGFVDKLAIWASQHDFGFCFRGKGWGAQFQSEFDALAGSGIADQFVGALEDAPRFVDESTGFVFIQFGYGLKNQLENLHSKFQSRVPFPDIQLIVPKWTILLNADQANVFSTRSAEEAKMLIEAIGAIDLLSHSELVSSRGERCETSQADYLQSFSKLQHHIKRGDVYQCNLCREMHWNNAEIDAPRLFNHGFEGNPNPFSVYYKWQNNHALCFSPERFMSLNGQTMISQPMKGTSPRDDDNPVQDAQNRDSLQRSEKDRRENVMIVDMVRNDLSHYAETGSVKVPELYKVDSYARIHQMHSTVIARLRVGVSPLDAILKAFPMGSMTGAPKIRAMQIIEDLEWSERGLFSGSIGFVTPDKNYDLNVVIRTLIYNSDEYYLSCHAGGGVTAMSEAEAEFDETQVKAQPLIQLIERGL